MEQIGLRPASALGADGALPDSGPSLEENSVPIARAAPSGAGTVRSTLGAADDRRETNLCRFVKRRLRALLMIGGIAVVAVAAGIVWWRGGRFVSTDDAYVHSAKLMVSTDVSGIVTSVDVHEGQIVKAGDVLFQIDPQQLQIALDNAKANLSQVTLTLQSMKQGYRCMLSDVAAQQAQVALDQANFDRYATLARTDVVSRANYDQTRFALEADQTSLPAIPTSS